MGPSVRPQPSAPADDSQDPSLALPPPSRAPPSPSDRTPVDPNRFPPLTTHRPTKNNSLQRLVAPYQSTAKFQNGNPSPCEDGTYTLKAIKVMERSPNGTKPFNL